MAMAAVTTAAGPTSRLCCTQSCRHHITTCYVDKETQNTSTRTRTAARLRPLVEVSQVSLRSPVILCAFLLWVPLKRPCLLPPSRAPWRDVTGRAPGRDGTVLWNTRTARASLTEVYKLLHTPCLHTGEMCYS